MKTDYSFVVKNLFLEYKARGNVFQTGMKLKVLKNINLSMKSGSYYALVGASGSGKTTLAKLMGGFLNPTSGCVEYRGEELCSRTITSSFRRNVQMIFQNPYLSLDPRWTVSGIIAEGIKMYPKKDVDIVVGDVMEKVRLPLNYLNRNPRQLSGGERQRVAIARALVMKPEFLILDEPTSALDACAQADIVELLKDLRMSFSQGILFVTHDISIASQLADDLIVINEGAIVESRDFKNVLSNPGNGYTKSLIEAVPEI